MRIVPTIVILLTVLSVIQGQTKAAHPPSNAAHPKAFSAPSVEAAPCTQTVVQQQTPQYQSDGAGDDSQSTLVFLFSKKQLTNTVLAIIGTLGIVLGLCTLWQIKGQTDAIQRQVSIAKDALIASQRPRVTIKHVSLVPGRLVADKDGQKFLQSDNQWSIDCILANIGGSKATITKSNLTIMHVAVGPLEGVLPPLPPYVGRYSFQQFVLEAGERREEDVLLDVNEESRLLRIACENARDDRRQGRPTDTIPVVCIGYFRYRDESGISRVSGFGWQIHPYDMSLTKLANIEYNYED